MSTKTISLNFSGHICNESMKNAIKSFLDKATVPPETEEIVIYVTKYSDEYFFVAKFFHEKKPILSIRYKSHVIMVPRGSDWKPIENMGQFTDPAEKFYKIILPTQTTRF